MTANDLPRDWPLRPLTGPRFMADVLDLVVTGRSRAEGVGLNVLLGRTDDRLAQPCAVTDVPLHVTEAGSVCLTGSARPRRASPPEQVTRDTRRDANRGIRRHTALCALCLRQDGGDLPFAEQWGERAFHVVSRL
jgi:hypothetical protein